ncbi:hypothetical protein O0544_22380 [Edwardsiella anguillarum]|nr:hypothetical protein [Edwardsiella anguillarum]
MSAAIRRRARPAAEIRRSSYRHSHLLAPAAGHAIAMSNTGEKLMFTLLKDADVYQPQPLGRRDVLLCGEKIVAIEENLQVSALPGLREVIDCRGKILAPASSISMYT